MARRFWDRFTRFSRVIAFDKRGMGLSDREGEYTLENIAEDAVAVLDAAGSEQAAVFAVSEGGPAAAMLAAAYPDRVSAMVLYGSVHTGECELIGDDLGGIGVHIAARVQALAEPGEELVSNTVRDLVVGSGLRFQDRGQHALKGLPDARQLHSVVADEG